MEMKSIVVFLTCLSWCVLVQSYTHCDSSAKKWFGWCEQWGCEKNCTCSSADECKQYCGKSLCGMMKCRSKSTCTQSLHSVSVTPRAINMWAESPFVMQDCSEGKCDNLVVRRSSKRRVKDKHMAFQNCVDGECGSMVSKVEQTKQFCGNCQVMKCTGPFATNCTQKCVMGHCKRMICNARYCEQVCSHRSTCAMECGSNTIECKQICQLGSKCQMKCTEGTNCQQKCLNAGDCKIHEKESKYKFPDLDNGLEYPLARNLNGENITVVAKPKQGEKNKKVNPDENLVDSSRNVPTKKNYIERSGSPRLKYKLEGNKIASGSGVRPSQKRLSAGPSQNFISQSHVGIKDNSSGCSRLYLNLLLTCAAVHLLLSQL